MEDTKPSLLMLSGPYKGKEYLLSRQSTTLGRSPECDICLDSSRISRVHAEISAGAGGYSVRDNDSKNGVSVNGRQVATALLFHADEIEMGPFRMRFLLPDGKAVVQDESGGAIQAVDAAPVAPARASQPAYGAPEEFTKTAADEKTAAKNPKGLKFSALSLLIAMSVALAIAVLALSFKREAPPPRLIIMKAGETRMLNLKKLLPLRRESDLPDRLESVNSAVARVRFDDEHLRRWLIVIKAETFGENLVMLKKQDGSLVGKLKISVRGILESAANNPDSAILSEGDLLARANDAVLKGDHMADDSPYLALARYQEAMELLETRSQKKEIYFTAKEKHDNLKASFDKRIEALWERYKVARKNEDIMGSLAQLKHIRDLIPDEQNLDHQRAMIYRGELMPLAEAQSALQPKR